MSFYEQNLQSLLRVNPKLASLLFGLKTNKKFEVFVDEKDPLNINIIDVQREMPLYKNVPIQETEEYLQSFMAKYQRYPYLYFFGLGNGVFYKALLVEDTCKRVVVVEPELEIVFMALHFNDFTQALESGRLVLVLASDVTFALASDIFMHPESRIFSKTYQFHTLLPYYEIVYGEVILIINRIFLQAIEHAVRGLGNDSTDALIGLQHQVANIDKMVHTPTTLELIKKVKNSEVAVIISTGPSLKKQLPLLKTIRDHATLFCIDASLPILEKEGIKPDVVISLERVIETAKFYTETSKSFQEDIIYVITSIAHPDLFKEIHAGTLQISMRPFGYTSYFEMPEYGYLGIGMSAANMAYELVFHADFKTCILIGQDLAYGADGTTHSDGHIYGIEDKSDNQRYRVPAYGGEGMVETTLIWKLFKNFFESDISYANAKGTATINATEGGARIDGTLEMPFVEAIEKYVDFGYHKEQIILQKPDTTTIEKNLKKADEKIKHMLSFATKLQKEVEATFLHVALACENIASVEESERYEKLDYQALADVMEEIDHIKNYFDDQEFANIFTDATQAMILHQEIELAKIQVRNVLSDNDKRQKMIDWVLAHKYWLFSLAGMMQATIDAVNMGTEMKIDFESIKLIRVYLDDKEIDSFHPKGTSHVNHSDELINNIFDLKQLCINYELDKKYKKQTNKLKFYYSDEAESFKVEVHMPNRDDNHFSEFAFKNSLEATIDKERIENLYEKDAIGFLAVEENLEDEDFVEYIKELMLRFPHVAFKTFCFSDEEKKKIHNVFSDDTYDIELLILSNISQIATHIEIFLVWIDGSSYQNAIASKITKYFNNIGTIYASAKFHKNTKTYDCDDDKLPNAHLMIQALLKNGITNEELISRENRASLVLIEHFLKNQNIEYKISDERFEFFAFDYLYLMLHYQEFKYYIKSISIDTLSGIKL